MDLRLTFNEDAANYDKSRPTYVPELFNKIIQYSGIDETKQALEIGIGTGQATLPIVQTNCKVTAIELGEKLAEYSSRKFAAFRNLEVINSDFESYSIPSNSVDLVYSATAFHWIPEEVGYKKVFDLLKSGGTLALFWNHPFVNRDNDLLHVEIRKVYNKYRTTNKRIIELSENECKKTVEILECYGFKNVNSELFFQTRTFTADGYIDLLNTYSDHRVLPEDVKKGLENEVKAAITGFGGTVQIYDTMDLYLAQKP